MQKLSQEKQIKFLSVKEIKFMTKIFTKVRLQPAGFTIHLTNYAYLTQVFQSIWPHHLIILFFWKRIYIGKSLSLGLNLKTKVL